MPPGYTQNKDFGGARNDYSTEFGAYSMDPQGGQNGGENAGISAGVMPALADDETLLSSG